MEILNFKVRIEGATSKDWDGIALRMARAARGRAKTRSISICAGSQDAWVLCENREPAKLFEPTRQEQVECNPFKPVERQSIA